MTQAAPATDGAPASWCRRAGTSPRWWLVLAGAATLLTNFFGIPNEGLAWSNNARGFAGPAKWKDASFNAATVGEQEIKVRY